MAVAMMAAQPSTKGKTTKRSTYSPTPQKSSKEKTKRPTLTYSPTPNRSPTNRCVPDDRPRPVRGGQRFRFNLVKANAQCVDGDDQLYEYGQFNNVYDFTECANVCVKKVSSELIDSGSFQGIDFDCRRNECRCLYDAGTLDRRNSRRFERTNRNEYGYGSIDGARIDRSSRDIYCGKLAGAEIMGSNEFLNAHVTELWDMSGED